MDYSTNKPNAKDIDYVEKMDVGIHQNGNKFETSVMVSNEDSKIETDLDNESTVLLT